MTLSLKTLNESRKLSKDESLIFINEMKSNKVISVKTAAYLTGFDLTERLRTEAEVSAIVTERDRKHKKALKFAKKKKLEAPELDTTPIDLKIVELSVNDYPRNHKEDLPQLEGLVLLQELSLVDTDESKGLSEDIKSLYYVIGGERFEIFFTKWALFLNANDSIRKSKTDNKWFILVLEDYLSLAASISTGVVYGGEPSTNKKDIFFNALK